MQQTSIGWTDFSANLLKYWNLAGQIVWACVHASEGCRFCYSEALAKRWGRGEAFTAENMKKLTPFFDIDEAQKILKSKKVAGKKIFIDDMTDLFGEWVPDEIIDQHFAIFALRPDVTFQVLTKRAKRMREYLSRPDRHNEIELACDRLFPGQGHPSFGGRHMVPLLPLANVHLGVSVEDQKNADERIPLLLETPATIRWVSIEPLLGDVDLTHVDYSSRLRETLGEFARWRAEKDGDDPDTSARDAEATINAPAYLQTLTGHWFDGWDCGNDGKRLNGIVIGGESGHGHREMPLESALNLARVANTAGVAVYFKQDSGPRPGMQGRVPDDVWAMKDWPEAKTVTVNHVNAGYQRREGFV